MDKCPLCRVPLASARRRQTVTIDGRRFVATLAAHHCKRCRASFIHGVDLETLNVHIGCALATGGRATGASFRFMRKTLGMRASTLGTLLGVTPETISRWENAQRPVDPNAWIAVGSLVLEHAGEPAMTLERLRRLQRGASLPKVVTIDMTTRPRSPATSTHSGVRPRRGALLKIGSS